ncbi:MAG: hypothetical protein QF463_13770 [Vicinamibacterales bacterium]|jgi:hypothetical protein|nr:hypothetical protein [Acidobacteriota bacterium]MDP6371710.1 hypothetical protein [Vicinamibacterales bacterium]MDP6610132.1 hypothetical protein [Vicinamibacterales bacterium]HAK56915.1 hypothetical protein [Acidobacteriota bacterium]|tara:strand:+ start:849 stop:1232 length:384 start_codon:yes stop_codon:yes gene_type:complete
MAVRTELSLRLPNSPGALADVCRLLSAEQVNVLAMSLDAGGTLRLVVDNHTHAEGVLRDRQLDVATRDALLIQVPNGPGALQTVGRMTATAGVNIDHACASAIEGHPMATVVIGVDDAARASAAVGV